MPSETVEDYIKHIYMLQESNPKLRVPMGRVAEALKVTPGTATAMIQTLSASSLVDYERRAGVRLTRSGERLALRVVRRHRLVEQFLVQIVGLDWSQVHDEAERLEHAVSDLLLERIDALLGHPAADPHGDPIPTEQGRVDQTSTVSLADAQLGRPVRIARIADQGRRFLQFAESRGLVPGTVLVVTHRDAAADALTLAVEGEAPFTIGLTAAAKILSLEHFHQRSGD